jgi:hypothetical protein
MPGAQGSPPDDGDVLLVLVDGDNLLHAVRGSRDEAGLRWLLPQLRAWLPVGMSVVVMLDGHPAAGEGFRRRVAPGIDIQHSGAWSADAALIGILEARPWGERGLTVVVSDDAELRDRVRRAGGRPRRTAWLVGRLAGTHRAPRRADPPAPGRTDSSGAPGARPQTDGRPVGIGRRRPRQDAPGVGHPGPGGEDERRPWTPGRGATRKRGNPKRGRPPSRDGG